MRDIHVIGLDIAKQVFHVVGLDKNGKQVMRKTLRRAQIAVYFTIYPVASLVWKAVQAPIIGREH